MPDPRIVPGEIAQAVVDSLRGAVEPTIELEVARWPAAVEIEGQPDQIEPMLRALVTEAAKALEGRVGAITVTETVVDLDPITAGGPVELEERRYLRLSVGHDGPGLSLERIRGLDQPPAAPASSGVAGADRIMRRHGGAIVVRSRSEGGAQVDLYFPLPLQDPGPAPDSVGYFAYGANLDREHMARTTPGAVALGRAVLPDHRVLIAAAGYATLGPAPGEEVHGFLWRLTPEDERRLDQFEGVPVGLYRKARAMVRTANGEERPVMIYLASDPTPGLAARGYLDQILRAAEALGFPPGYRAALARLPSTPDLLWSGHPT
jgi:gamma-glutamylcyclotransferase (GGCT)/AIG2-like uncharacterized protein YtfP